VPKSKKLTTAEPTEPASPVTFNVDLADIRGHEVIKRAIAHLDGKSRVDVTRLAEAVQCRCSTDAG